jgi:GTP-binding protein YchF
MSYFAPSFFSYQRGQIRLNIGIVGVPQVGKTTLFRLLTNLDADAAKRRANIGVAMVPDARIDFLSSIFAPRKTTYAHINVTDTPGLQTGHSAELLAALKGTDALVVVVRAFEAATVPTAHADGCDPLADVQAVDAELVVNDWALLDTRLERLKKGSRNPQSASVVAALERVAETLADGKPLREQALTEEDCEALQGMAFYSDKPLIVVVNTDERQMRSGDYPGKARLTQWCNEHDAPLLEVCAQLEMEISELNQADRALFLQDLGIAETGLTRLARVAYEKLGLFSFFTVGEDEVKAWTIRKNSTAQQAAGKIHSDIARGFIRADVVSYAAFKEHQGKHLRENGLRRLEGREYVVEDGDIIDFRFNV